MAKMHCQLTMLGGIAERDRAIDGLPPYLRIQPTGFTDFAEPGQEHIRWPCPLICSNRLAWSLGRVAYNNSSIRRDGQRSRRAKPANAADAGFFDGQFCPPGWGRWLRQR